MERFNTAMEEIQNDGTMAAWLEVRGKEVRAREWAKLVDVVHDQAYSRVVGPYSNELEVSASVHCSSPCLHSAADLTAPSSPS